MPKYKERWGIGTEIYDGTNPNQIALTFDDGPNDPYTFRLLDILSQHGAMATFFMIGQHVRKRSDIAKAVYSAGHIIGNHTNTHPNLTALSPKAIEGELTDCQKAIEDATGNKPLFFRPPYGASNTVVEQTVAALGLRTVIWSVIPEDWTATSAGLIVRRICKETDSRSQGEIILLHDGAPEQIGVDRSYTVGATRKLLKQYSNLRFVSLSAFQC
jgi:peptidoglycan/xylan/chitin deacetylase (PgdA/CDA1 family)